jgi:hypothetical protein
MVAGLLLFVVASACSEAGAPGTGQPPASTGTASPAPAASAAPAGSPEPQTVADIFPPGPQREAVMNNCGSCHNLACAAIGQRSAERWDALRDSHKDKLANADLNGMFEYLKANFNASRPEPKIPPRFLEGGCTPF